MAIPLSLICPRCGRHNVSRARFCAQCGLNLVASGANDVSRVVRQAKRKGGTGIVLFVILLGLFLAAMASMFRSRPCAVRPQFGRPTVLPAPMREEPWAEEDQHEVERPAHEGWGWNERR